MIKKEYGTGAGKLTLHITSYTLNETQRRYPALAEKEAAGWWCGSIETVAYTHCRLKACPTVEEVAIAAWVELSKLRVHTTVEEILGSQIAGESDRPSIAPNHEPPLEATAYERFEGRGE